MKKRANDSVSLIEMIVCIAFFAISCAIIFQMLTTGVTRSVESDDLTWASIEAQSMAESVKKLNVLTGFDSPRSDSKISKIISFDSKKQPVSGTDGVYKVILDATFEPQNEGNIVFYDIFVKKQGKEIFKISSCKYFEGGL